MSEYLLSIDPSLRATGCALFLDGELVDVHLIRWQSKQRGQILWRGISLSLNAWLQLAASKHLRLSGLSIDAHMERPVHHRGVGRRADPETLLEMAMLVGYLCATLCTGDQYTLWTKAQWAGTAPKNAVTARVEARISPAETAVLAETYKGPPSLRHNVLDAVGVGLHALGRMKQ